MFNKNIRDNLSPFYFSSEVGMRLWHYELVRALPDNQLLSQWRELCAIGSRINKIGYPNHLLVNKVMDYSYKEILLYAERVIEEMNYRRFKIHAKSYDIFYKNILSNKNKFKNVKQSVCGQFKGWHDSKYYYQCFFNLQEKYDCGGIKDYEWERILKNKKFFDSNSRL